MRFAMCSLLLALLLSQSAAAGETSPSVVVTLTPAGLSVEASAAPLRDVLAEISRVTGVPIYVESSLGTAVSMPMTVTLPPLPPENALRRLLRERDFVLAYGPAGLDEVRVYGDRHGEFSRIDVAGRDGRAIGPPAEKELRVPQPVARGEIGEGDLPGLRNAALSDTEEAQRSGALDRMADFSPNPLVRDTALAVLERERDEMVLDSALHVLLLEDSLPVDRVLRFAETAPSAALRIQALEIVNQRQSSDPAFRRLLGKLVTDRDEDVREAARSLLAALDD